MRRSGQKRFSATKGTAAVLSHPAGRRSHLDSLTANRRLLGNPSLLQAGVLLTVTGELSYPPPDADCAQSQDTSSTCYCLLRHVVVVVEDYAAN